MSDLPNSTDVLFQEESDSRNGAWMKNPANKHFLYSQGYLMAANTIYTAIESNTFRQNTLVYPMIFNYRQFVELQLKELSAIGNKYLDRDKDFDKGHELKKLWDEYRNNILKEISPYFDQAMLDNVEKLIIEFEAEDPGSTNYRYPFKLLAKGAAPSAREISLTRDTLDLKNFKETIDKLVNFFAWQWDLLDSSQIMRDEILSDY